MLVDLIMLLFTQTLDTNKKSYWINSKQYIVLHHTWSESSFNSMMNYWAKSDAQVSWHYTIWKKWEIGKIGNDNDILWHAWDNSDVKLNWISYYNPVSIWIEVISDWKSYTNEQREAVELLVKYLAQTYKIPKENILRHKDITNRKWDISDEFWNNKFKTYDDYINNTYWEIDKENEELRKLDRIKIYNDTSWERPLIEIWVTRVLKDILWEKNFKKLVKIWRIKMRKENEK